VSFLVDTDVLSDAVKKAPSIKVNAWIQRHQSEIYTSAVSIGELKRGIARMPSGSRRTQMERWLEGLLVRMNGRILAYTSRVAETWGELTAQLEHRGHKMPLADSLIAAIAKRHNLTIATRNTTHFTRAGLRVVNPFVS
jgi:predicted nucleic acid-binding protein